VVELLRRSMGELTPAERRIARAVLAGMSQGGFLSLRCALTHPNIVRALILIDTQAGQEDPERLKGHMQLANAWAEQGLSDELAAIIEGIIPFIPTTSTPGAIAVQVLTFLDGLVKSGQLVAPTSPTAGS